MKSSCCVRASSSSAGRTAHFWRRGGLYAEMWTMQREASEAEEALRRAREADALGVIERRRPAGVV